MNNSEGIALSAGVLLVASVGTAFMHGWNEMSFGHGIYYAIATLVTLLLLAYVFLWPQQFRIQKQVIVVVFALTVFASLATHGNLPGLFRNSVGRYVNKFSTADEVNALRVIIKSDSRYANRNIEIDDGWNTMLVVTSEFRFSGGEKQSIVTKLQRIYPNIIPEDIEWISDANSRIYEERYPRNELRYDEEEEFLPNYNNDYFLDIEEEKDRGPIDDR